MSWIEDNPELTVGIAALASAAIGYYFRAWRERQENLKEALYLLAEIWHRSTVAFNLPIDAMFDALLKRLREVAPEAEFTEEQVAATRAYFRPILERATRFHAMDGIDTLYGAYEKVVHLIARTDPIFAYDLDAASTIKRRLSFLDQYLQEAFQPLDSQGGAAQEFSNNLRAAIKEKAEGEATQELEGHLRRLSRILGPKTWLLMTIRIGRRKRVLAKGPDLEKIEKLISEVLVPVVRASDNQLNPPAQASAETQLR